jgi:FtsP/CotA-like multicopper oxidase with cupredoxin domain
MGLAVAVLIIGVLAAGSAMAANMPSKTQATSATAAMPPMRSITNAQRREAASRLASERLAAGATPSATLGALSAQAFGVQAAALTPGATPDYYGIVPNFANSPLPSLDSSGNPVFGTGIRKFVDSLPGLGAASANDLGQYIPVAVPDTTAYSGSDYYVIGLVEYTQKLHKDLPATKLRGYVQLNDAGTVQMTPPSYLGPAIVAQKNRPVRIKFINKLPTGTGGDLFLPVDDTVMGAGLGPDGVTKYKQNRGTLHLHGGNTPWISDGTPHQWTTPATESTPWPKGVSVRDVPDMPAAGPGEMTFFYTNQQTARLMFYHDHSYGITRLNVYAGEAAPYLVQDSAEAALVNGGAIVDGTGATVNVPAGTVPADQYPLVIQDKTFVPNDTQLAAQDPTWDKAKWGGLGSLWYPHVYMPNQDPSDYNGVNSVGRWDYSFWFYPPLVGVANGPVANPLFGQPGEPPQNPGVPNVSLVPEAFMDTPLVNGTAYPYLKVGRKAYRFRILNAANDRMLNLQIYYAKANTPDSVDTSGNPTLQTLSGEVPMVPAAPSTITTWPATWPKDGRDGGVPDPNAAGPSMIQIGTEGGWLPIPVVIPNQPVNYEYNRRTILFANVTSHGLLIGPAERADVIVDFSGVPAGSKLILYNDAPAPMPGFDSRNDYYTGDPDQTSIGGAPTTKAGYGPNTRTIMQFDVSDPSTGPAVNMTNLANGLKAAFGGTQDKPIVPESVYGQFYGTTFPDTYARIADTSLSFTPIGQTVPVTESMQDKAIIEGFEMDYGRMNAQLGVGLPNLGPTGGAAIPYGYADPPVLGSPTVPGESIFDTVPGTLIGTLNDGTQIWHVEHQGVDTHVLHFHLFNVQLINRVAIDGQLLPPDTNELGWKESVRMNPGTNVILALRPLSQNLPFKLPDSIRPANPLVPLGATYMDGQGLPIVNSLFNFGWEYVWHCHLLGHEENDMMRPIVFRVSPTEPANLLATPSAVSVNAPTVALAWTNSATIPAATNYLIQRSTNSGFTAGTVATLMVAGTPSAYTDNSVAPLTQYWYRVRAENAASYSAWSNTVSVTTAARIVVGSSLTIVATPTSVRLPTPFTLTGTLAPPAPGGVVSVYVRRPGSARWSYSSNRTLDALSNWWYRYTPTLRGTYSFYAIIGTTRSRTISVTVR